jgi:hypothetical protein
MIGLPAHYQTPNRLPLPYDHPRTISSRSTVPPPLEWAFWWDKPLDRWHGAQLVGASRIDSGISSAEDEAKLKDFVTKHQDKTGSPLATRILADWKGHLAEFWKVTPHIPAAHPNEEKKIEEGKTIITEHITASPKA